MVLLAYRHAFRPGELVRLRWDDIDWNTQTLHCRRLKNGIDSVHPLSTRELKFLRRLKKEQTPSRYLFMSERGSPITTDMFRKLVQRLGEVAGFDFALHPHMLRHSAGHVLVSKGVPIRALQLFMGHKQIQNTTKYAQLSQIHSRTFGKIDGDDQEKEPEYPPAQIERITSVLSIITRKESGRENMDIRYLPTSRTIRSCGANNIR